MLHSCCDPANWIRPGWVSERKKECGFSFFWTSKVLNQNFFDDAEIWKKTTTKSSPLKLPTCIRDRWGGSERISPNVMKKPNKVITDRPQPIMMKMRLSFRMNSSRAASQPSLWRACGLRGSGGFWQVIPRSIGMGFIQASGSFSFFSTQQVIETFIVPL